MPTEENINAAAEKAVNFSFGSSYEELYDDILKNNRYETARILKSPKKSNELSERAWQTTPL